MRSRWILPLSFVLLAGLAYLVRLPIEAFEPSAAPVTPSPRLINHFPLPELSGSTVYRQQLVAASVPAIFSELDEEDRVAALVATGSPISITLDEPWFVGGLPRMLQRMHLCVDILFGTYEDRERSGTISVSVQSSAMSLMRVLDVAEIRDGEYHRTCFPEARLDKIVFNAESYILIAPISTEPGSSVTVFATEDGRGGRLVEPASAAGSSLSYHFSAQSESAVRARMLTVAFGLLSVLVLAVAVSESGRNVTQRRY